MTATRFGRRKYTVKTVVNLELAAGESELYLSILKKNMS